MKIAKQILRYLIWIVLSFLLGISYMRLILGPKEGMSSSLLDVMFALIYDLGLIYIGLRIGVVIAFLFIVADVFYLKRKLENNKTASLIRFVSLLSIAVFVTVFHYLLEKVIDIL